MINDAEMIPSTELICLEKIAETAIYGGYPAVYLSENDEERREVLTVQFPNYQTG